MRDHPYYVLLVGAKNNAGDFLIGERAVSLLKRFRPDRELVTLESWKPLDSSLDLVNRAEALILAGGPALQEVMWPNVYPLTEDLAAIRPPIVAFGIGWKSRAGDWAATRDYPLSERTLTLLRRIEQSPCTSSVRDYHTLNVLQRRGFCQFRMTGCPALFAEGAETVSYRQPETIGKIGFSLGVSPIDSAAMEQQMKDVILRLHDRFPAASLEIAFHHSLSPAFLQSYPSASQHLQRHLEFARWLEGQHLAYRDISGSADNLRQFYDGCDLHFGYRVHAHIYLCSLGRPSILIAEDGRGKALKEVLGGMIFDGYRWNATFLNRLVSRCLRQNRYFEADPLIGTEAIELLTGELTSHPAKLAAPSQHIQALLPRMQAFVRQLP